MPPSPFPQVWKVLGLDLCHSEDTVIRVKGTQRAKKKHHPLTPPPRLRGYSHVLKEQVAATSCLPPSPSQRNSGKSTLWIKLPD